MADDDRKPEKLTFKQKLEGWMWVIALLVGIFHMVYNKH